MKPPIVFELIENSFDAITSQNKFRLWILGKDFGNVSTYHTADILNEWGANGLLIHKSLIQLRTFPNDAGYCHFWCGGVFNLGVFKRSEVEQYKDDKFVAEYKKKYDEYMARGIFYAEESKQTTGRRKLRV